MEYGSPKSRNPGIPEFRTGIPKFRTQIITECSIRAGPVFGVQDLNLDSEFGILDSDSWILDSDSRYESALTGVKTQIFGFRTVRVTQ